MPETLDEIKEHLGKLPSKDRAELAQFLFDTLDEEDSSEEDDALEAELLRRVDDIKTGKVTGRPMAEVFAELRGKKP